MNEPREPDPEAVIAIAKEASRIEPKMMKVSDLLDHINQRVGDEFISGMDCSILAPDSRWKDGRIRLMLVFEEVTKAEEEQSPH